MSQNNDTKVSTRELVLAEVADALANSGDEVRKIVVRTRYERARNRRVEIIDKAFAKRDQLQTEVYAIKPPGKKLFQLVDGKQVEVTPVYTQDELKKLEEDTKQFNKKLKEAQEKLQKFDDLFDAAINAPTDKVFDKLGKLVEGKSESSDSE